MNLWETPVIPLLYLIFHPGDFLQVALLREDSFKLLTSHFLYAYYVVRTSVLPFLIILALGRYLQQKDLAWRRLFVISLVLGVLYAAVTVEKAPVAAIAAVLGIFYYLFKGGKLGKMATVVFPLLFLSFPIIVVLFAYNGSEAGTLSGALQAMATRIFYSPAEVVYAYFEVFPGVLPFQHGAGMVKLGHLMGWTVIDIPNFVGVYMEGAKDLDTITANTCFIGNFNADFERGGSWLHYAIRECLLLPQTQDRGSSGCMCALFLGVRYVGDQRVVDTVAFGRCDFCASLALAF
jgi:hypothetical protein